MNVLLLSAQHSDSSVSDSSPHFFFCCADNLLETRQVMNVMLLSAQQSDSSVSDSSPLDLSDCSFKSSLS